MGIVRVRWQRSNQQLQVYASASRGRIKYRHTTNCKGSNCMCLSLTTVRYRSSGEVGVLILLMSNFTILVNTY